MKLKNVTITLEETVARWARIKAAEQDTSVSHLVGQMLKERMQAETGYEAARKRYLSAKSRVISAGRYPRRDELHER
jgi:hypothetical protein